MIGQINLNTKLGKLIYNITAYDDIFNIVEIGTWNGCGSTKCVTESILKNKKECQFYSIESNKDMYDIAIKNIAKHPHIHLLYGRIIEKTDLINPETLDDLFFKDYNRAIKYTWYEEDVKCFEKTPNVLDTLPKKIDLLILDGGEFSTYAEFQLLKNNSKYIIIDDTKCIKSFKIREELLTDNNFEIINDNQIDRNGFIIVKNLKYEKSNIV